jgi:hypothetical protein
VNKRENGKLEIGWQLPTLTFIRSILKNPIYAGVYIYGRNTIKTIYSDGHLIKKRTRKSSPEESRVFIRDHHEAYISWDSFEENQKMLLSNSLKLGKDESSIGSLKPVSRLLTKYDFLVFRS